MRREPRCEHLFLMGLCREKGCPHEEKGRARASRRVKARTCKRCGGPATVNIRSDGGSNWWCEGCNSTRRDSRVRGYLWTLMLALAGCGCTCEGFRLPSAVCGGQIRGETVTPAEGQCLLARSPEGSVAMDGDCPNEDDHCLVALPGESVTAWRRLSQSPMMLQPPDEADLATDGSCPLSCEDVIRK